MDLAETVARRVELVEELARCRAFLEPALRRNGGTHEWGDVAGLVLDGKAQLWPAKDAAMVTELVTYPRKKVLNLWLGGGKLSRLLDMGASIEVFAQSQGCDAITIHGRRGWERALKANGARALHTTLIKEIAL